MFSAVLMKLYKGSSSMVLSCPHSSRSGVPKFPTRTRNAEGVVRRGVDRKFSSNRMEWCDLVPSVCVCTEFCVFRPKVLKDFKAWKSSPISFTEDLQKMGCQITVPTTIPFLENDKRLYADVLQSDTGCHLEGTSTQKLHKIGLSSEPNDAEKIAKFGSCKAAKLTLQFL